MIISEWEMYWLTRLDSINGIASGLCVVGWIVTIVVGIIVGSIAGVG